MAASGSFSGSVLGGGYTLLIQWSASQNIEKNRSAVTADVSLRIASGWRLEVYGRSGFVTIGETKLNFTSPAIEGTGTVHLGTVQTTVSHRADGTASCALSAAWAMQADIDGVWVESISASGGTVTLDPIPRASAFDLSAGSVTLNGEAVTLTAEVTPVSMGFSHVLSYDFLGETVEVSLPAGQVKGKLTFPMSLLNKIPNSVSGDAAVTLTTYSGETPIGTASKTIAVRAGSAIVPTVTGFTASPEADDLPGNWDIFVKGLSRPRLITQAVGAYGSSITGISTGGSDVLGAALTEAGERVLSVTVTDSRGRTAKKSLTISVLDYFSPYILEASVQRTDSQGTPMETGGCLALKAAAAWAELGGRNACTVTARIYSAQGALLQTAALPSGQTEILGGSLSQSRSYQVCFTATDSLGRIGETWRTAPSARRAFHLMEGGQGGAFGGYAEEADCLDIKWKKLKLDGKYVAPVLESSGGGEIGGLWFRIGQTGTMAEGESLSAVLCVEQEGENPCAGLLYIRIQRRAAAWSGDCRWLCGVFAQNKPQVGLEVTSGNQAVLWICPAGSGAGRFHGRLLSQMEGGAEWIALSDGTGGSKPDFFAIAT